MKHLDIRMADNNTYEIIVMGDVGWDISAQNFIQELKYLSDYNIIISLYSAGGNAMDALAIYDYVKANNINAQVNIYGLCGSAATIIASAFSPTIAIGDNSFYFIHHAYGGNENSLDKVNERVNSIYKNLTGLSKKEVENLLDAGDAGEILTATEAKKLGFVNKIFKEQAIAANMNEIIANYKNKYVMSKEDNSEEKGIVTKILDRIDKGFVSREAHNTIKAEKDSLTADLKAKDDTIAELQAKLDTAEGDQKKEIDTIKAEKDSLTADLKAKDDTIAELQAKLDTAEGEPLPKGDEEKDKYKGMSRNQRIMARLEDSKQKNI